MRGGFWSGVVLLILLSLAAPSAGAGPRAPGAYSPVIDSKLERATLGRKVERLPGLGRRKVAAARTKGVTFAFVEDELTLSTNDPAEARALAKRWNGRVVRTVHLRGGPKQKDLYLIRVDTSHPPAGAFNREDNLVSVSSEKALALLKIATTERSQGRRVGLNLMTNFTSLETGVTTEGGTPGANPATWDYMQKGGPLDVDVIDAWRALALTGKTKNKVKVAILDQGFGLGVGSFDEADWDGGAALHWPADDDTAEDSFPWHGNHSADAFGATADDGEGAAGPAGPVADEMELIPCGYTIIGMAYAWEEAMKKTNAKIISLSLSIEFPQTGAASILTAITPLETFEDATAYAGGEGGRLVFASAGNGGTSVDVTDDGDETVWWFPCENHGVICVNGWANKGDTGYGSSPHSLSNWGQGKGDTVDIAGPFTVFVGNSPDSPDPETVRKVSGTSVSTPFVAGVAALVWAANPKLTNAEVWDILRTTAYQANPNILRVKAYAAVREALRRGGNAGKPVVTIVQPATPGAPVFQVGKTKFQVTTFDPEDGFDCCTAIWSSDLDGVLGKGFTIEKAFPGAKAGPRAIRVDVADSQGHIGTAQTVVVLNNAAPTVQITKIPPGPVFVGVPQPFGGLVFDDSVLNGLPDLSACPKLHWTAVPKMAGTGCDVVITFDKPGTISVVAVYTDAQGATGSALVKVPVLEKPAGPAASILNPTPGNIFDFNEEIPVKFKIVEKLPPISQNPFIPAVANYQEIWTLTWIEQGQTKSVTMTDMGPGKRRFRFVDVFPGAATALAVQHFRLTLQAKNLDSGIVSNPYSVDIKQTAEIH